MSYQEIKAVKGVRNDVAPERFSNGDLLYANSIDIDETGKCNRRHGTTTLFSGAAHSAYASVDPEMAFFVQNGYLNRFIPGAALQQLAPVTGTKVAYCAINNSVHWTDGLVSGIITPAGTNKPWGITPPAPVQLTPIAGNLTAGTYLVTMTYVDVNGKESGAPGATYVTLGADITIDTPNYADSYTPGGGIKMTNLSVSLDPQVVSKNIYMTDFDGGVPLYAGNIPNSQTGLTVLEMGNLGIAVRTQYWGPPPPGQVLGVYKGRAYVANGNYLFHSQPYEYELFDLRTGFTAFKEPVRTFAPVADGIFIGTTQRTMFLRGNGPDDFVQVPLSQTGTVLGTEAVVPTETIGMDAVGGSKIQGNAVLWMSQRGVVLGMDGGSIRDLTAGRFAPPAGLSTGGALFKYRFKTPQYIASLFS